MFFTFAFFNQIQPILFIFILQSIASPNLSQTFFMTMKSITLSQFTNRYKVMQKLGNGGFGDVFSIQDIDTKQLFALKKIRLRKNESLAQFLREIQIQIFLAHSLVLKIFEFYVSEAQNHYLGKITQIGIVMELGKCSLSQLIRDKSQQFHVDEIINFAYHFIKLFAYFQDQNIVHRDIKPDNFMQFGPGLQCKLIDFGLCTHIDDIRSIAGSFHYFSPKLKKLQYNPSLKLKTNPFKDDVYSFGMTLYEVITRRIGQASAKWGNSRYARDVFHHTKNNQLTDILELMLMDDEDKRPDFIELFEIFNEKFTFYEEGQYDQNDQSEQIKEEQLSIQQMFPQTCNNENLTKNKKKEMKKENKKNNNILQNEQICKTYKQQVIFENGEYEFRTIRDVEKENQGNIQNYQQNFQSFQKQEQCQWEPQLVEVQQTDQVLVNENNQQMRQNGRNRQNQKYQQQKYMPTIFQQQNETQSQQTQTLQVSQFYREQPLHNNLNNSQNQLQIPQSIPSQQPTEKGYKRKNYHLGSKISIRSIIIIKQFIICGCQDGSIYVINTQNKDKKGLYRLQGMNYKHTSPITVMGKDEFGRLWTGSESNQLLIWDRQMLFRNLLIQSFYHQQTLQCTNKKGEKYTKINNYIEMSPDVNSTINLPYHHPSGISSLYCFDDLNFVVGYNDGHIFTVWNNFQVHYKAHQRAVTGIQVHKNHLFTSSIDGSIKAVYLQKIALHQNQFTSDLPIRSFHVSGEVAKPNFTIVTADCRAFIVDGWSMTLAEEQKKVDQLDITAVMFVNQFIFTLGQNGNLYRDGLIFQKCKGLGWSCMHWNNDNMMVMGSLQGQLVMIKAG